MKETRSIEIDKFTNNILQKNINDEIIEEAPLQIIIDHGKIENRRRENLSVTMRTPGDDINLVTGFLYCEGIIQQVNDILSVRSIANPGTKNQHENIILAELSPNVHLDLAQKKRNFISAAACGFCGKTVADIHQNIAHIANAELTIPAITICNLPAVFNTSQQLFSKTGGVHAVALLDADGKLIHIAEDVGRHNAMDKLIGAMLHANNLPLQEYMLLFSGRLGYELLQKSVMAGISVVCAMGAPSSLAVEIAREYGITLVGFLKQNSFNIYSGAERIIH